MATTDLRGAVRHRIPEFLRFLLAGGVNSLLTLGLYMLLLFVVSYSGAYTLSYLAGILMGYYLNARFVFKERLRISSALQFPLVYAAQYAFGLFLLYFLVEKAHVSKYAAPVLILFVSVPFTYLLSRFLIKRTRTSGCSE